MSLLPPVKVLTLVTGHTTDTSMYGQKYNENTTWDKNNVSISIFLDKEGKLKPQWHCKTQFPFTDLIP